MLAEGMLPRILVIGAQKAGTSWVHENIAHNESVFTPPFKELHFFDYKYLSDSKRWAKWHVRSSIRKLKSRNHGDLDMQSYLSSISAEPILNGNWYKLVYSRARRNQVGIDVTPEYCSIPEEGIAFVRRFLKDPSIIYIIRDPVKRAVSQIKMNMLRKKISLDDCEAWEDAAKDPVIMMRGDYKSYVPRWDKHFSNVLYLPFSMIASDPHGFLRKIENHCGLENWHYPSAGQKVFEGSSIQPPSHILDMLMELHRDQNIFLCDRFGAEFFSLT